VRRPTAVAMWGAYVAHAAATGLALRHPDHRVPVPTRFARPMGWTGTLAGILLCGGGMRRFSGIRRLEGTQPQPLTTNGIYRWSRNPQCLSYLTALGGAALARRSLTAAALTGTIGLAYAAWIPVEEQQLTHRHGKPTPTTSSAPTAGGDRLATAVDLLPSTTPRSRPSPIRTLTDSSQVSRIGKVAREGVGNLFLHLDSLSCQMQPKRGDRTFASRTLNP